MKVLQARYNCLNRIADASVDNGVWWRPLKYFRFAGHELPVEKISCDNNFSLSAAGSNAFLRWSPDFQQRQQDSNSMDNRALTELPTENVIQQQVNSDFPIYNQKHKKTAATNTAKQVPYDSKEERMGSTSMGSLD